MELVTFEQLSEILGLSKEEAKYPEIYDKDKTEEALMLEAGFDRVYDCGTITFGLDKENK